MLPMHKQKENELYGFVINNTLLSGIIISRTVVWEESCGVTEIILKG